MGSQRSTPAVDATSRCKPSNMHTSRPTKQAASGQMETRTKCHTPSPPRCAQQGRALQQSCKEKKAAAQPPRLKTSSTRKVGEGIHAPRKDHEKKKQQQPAQPFAPPKAEQKKKAAVLHSPVLGFLSGPWRLGHNGRCGCSPVELQGCGRVHLCTRGGQAPQLPKAWLPSSFSPPKSVFDSGST